MALNVPSVSPAYAHTAEQPRRGPGRSFVGAVALAILVAGSAFIVLICANRPTSLIPSSNPNWFPHWLAGPLGGLLPMLTHNGKVLEDLFTFGLIAMYAVYVLAIAYVPSLRARWAIAAIVAVHVVFLLSPPLSLTDVFNYINYGRMEVVYHLNPYATIPTYEPHADLAYLLSNWHELLSPYGPLFTILTFAIVPLGVAGAFWAVKGLLVLASLGIIFLVWRCAELLGKDPVRAIVFVGLNPVVLVFGLGGDHNDFITVFFVMLGVYLLLRIRHSALDERGEPLDEEEQAHPGASLSQTAPADRRRAWLPVALGEAFVTLRGRAAAVRPAHAAGRVASGAVVGAAAPGLVAHPAGAAGGSTVGAPARTTVGVPASRRRRWAATHDRTVTREQLRAWAWPLAPLEIAAGASLMVAAGMKASAAVIAPVALCSLRPSPRRVLQVLFGMALAAAVIAVATYVAFGAHLPDLSTQGTLVTNESLPNLLGYLLGLGGEGPGLQHVMQVVLVVWVAGACVLAWRHHEMLRPAAWATLALLVTLSWILPWYILWLLPLVALARSRALVRISLVFGLYLLIVWVPLAGGWYRDIGFYPGSTKLGQQHASEVKALLDY
jgi:hypothetical protein